MVNNMEWFLDFLKHVCLSIVLVLAVFGFVAIPAVAKIPNKVIYYKDGNIIPAIEYENEIYLKKGE